MQDPVQDPNDKPEETIADVVAEDETQTGDFQAAYNAGGHFKEQLEAIANKWDLDIDPKSTPKEITQVEEVHTNPELKEPELKGYIEKVETEVEDVTIDPTTGQAIMHSTTPTNPTVTLPLTDDQIQAGLHHKVFDALRWLAEWCVRQLKKMHKTVKLE